jgi:hypothetical protein
VFQVRGIQEKDQHLQPVILSHSGRALTLEQERSDGKYWSYPFRKGLEIYNQDKLLLDMEACSQTGASGLILVEGFFDVAKLVDAGCRNVGALMGAHISVEQIERLNGCAPASAFLVSCCFWTGTRQVEKELGGQPNSFCAIDLM